MLIDYMRVSKEDGSEILDMLRDALLAAGIDTEHVCEDQASASLDARPGLTACLKALRKSDRLMVWNVDRLGRNLSHLINTVTVYDLTTRGVGFQALTGHGALINTATPEGKLVFGIFATLAEFERELVSERTEAALASARARGRKGGGQYKMTSTNPRVAMAAMTTGHGGLQDDVVV